MAPRPKQDHPYLVDIARRLVILIQDKLNQPGCGETAKRGRFSLLKLSRDSGVPYITLRRLLAGRLPSIPILDAVLYGLKLTVVDLIQVPELARRYNELDHMGRYIARTVANSGESPSTRSRRKTVPLVLEIPLDTNADNL